MKQKDKRMINMKNENEVRIEKGEVGKSFT